MIGNVLIFELIFVLLSAFAPVHSLSNLKIYLFMSKKGCNFAPQTNHLINVRECMIRKKNDIIGGYSPAFFEMQVMCSSNNFDLNTMSNVDLTICFHEYIHFLQDITTIYGLNNIYVYSEYLSGVLNRLYKQNKPSAFDVPYQINDNSDNVLLNRQIGKVTLGDSDVPSSVQTANIFDIMIDDYTLLPNPNLSNIKQVTLCLKTQNGEDEFYSFGALAIMENMAYLMERLSSPNDYINSPDYPYTVAEKVSDFYVNGFSKNSEMILALCDMCLMASNPGWIYVKVMQGIKNGDVHFNRPEDIYDHFYSQTVQSVYNVERPFIKSFEQILTTTKAKMKAYIKDIPTITEDFYSWIDKLYSFAVDCRNKNKYYFLEMARAGELKRNQIFINTINQIGSPLMTRDNKSFYKIPHDRNSQRTDVEYFKAIGQIASLFETGKKSCSLYEWCNNNPLNPTNMYCKNNPWKKCAENNMCFYALLWKHWNLIGYTPQ